MNKQRRASFALATIMLTGCAGGYKASYVAGAVTKQFATESYEVYSKEFNERLDKCDPGENVVITTKTEFDECMGKHFNDDDHGKIELGVKAYHEAAIAHSEVMVAVNADPQERKEATKKVIDSAIKLLSMFPDGERLVKTLKKLTRTR